MFLAWCVLRGLAQEHPDDAGRTDGLARLKRREITGGELLAECCDGKRARSAGLLDD